jgi:hypothetical protein
MVHIVLKISCAAALLAITAVTAPAVAAPPVIEHVKFEDSVHDDFLSEECGVDVTLAVSGTEVFITPTGGNGGLIGVHTINVGLTATAGDNTFRFRDVGADVLRMEPDGTLVLSIIGQLPFDFTGVLKIDLDTGEAILEPQHVVDTTRACAALTG